MGRGALSQERELHEARSSGSRGRHAMYRRNPVPDGRPHQEAGRLSRRVVERLGSLDLLDGDREPVGLGQDPGRGQAKRRDSKAQGAAEARRNGCRDTPQPHDIKCVSDSPHRFTGSRMRREGPCRAPRP